MEQMQHEELKLIEMQRHSQDLESTFKQVQAQPGSCWAEDDSTHQPHHQHRDTMMLEMMRRMEELMARVDELSKRMSGKDPCNRDRDSGQRQMTEENVRALVAQQMNLQASGRCEELSTRLGVATEATRRLESEKRALEEELDKMAQEMVRQSEEIQCHQHTDLEETLRHVHEKVQFDRQSSGQSLRQWHEKFLGHEDSVESRAEPEQVERKAERRWNKTKSAKKNAADEYRAQVKGSIGKLGGA
jgi:hypothetical protein